MATLKKPEFIERHRRQALDVQRLPANSPLTKADLDRNGVIQGDAELGAVFDAIDAPSRDGELDLQAGPEAAAYRALTVAFRQTETVEGPLGPRYLEEVPELKSIYDGVPGACLEHWGNFGNPRTSTGTGVVQDALIEVGYPIALGTNRGLFGDGTRAAVTRFQRDHGVQDRYGPGFVGPETLAALDDALAAARNGSQPPSPTPSPTPPAPIHGPSWLTARPALWPTVAAPSATPKRGDFGPDVQWVQSRLIEYGYLPASLQGDATAGFGNFGPMTEVAVSSLQAWNGLPATGACDSVTMQLLSRVPDHTASGKARLEGGVSLDGLTEAQKAQYLARLFALNNPDGVPFNADPGGINVVQIRGFADDAALQNVPNQYNDTMYVLINGPDGKPERVEGLTASSDFGDLDAELGQGFGWRRPSDPDLGPVFGSQTYATRGLGMTRPGHAIEFVFGRHYSGSTGVDRGLGFRDPVQGRRAVQVNVDFNHNGQIDGAEWDHTYANVGNNVHRGNTTSARVGPWSAGCHTLPTDGAYQRFTELVLGSAQVKAYLRSLVASGMSQAQAEARVFGERRKDGVNYADGNGVFMGPVGGTTPVRFAFALVDSRSLPDPATLLNESP